MGVIISTAILLFLLLSSWQDVVMRRIPDSLNAAMAVFGLFWLFAIPAEFSAWSIARPLMLFIFLVPLCGSGLLGGGDVKMMAALSLGLSSSEFWNFLWFSAIAGGVLGIAYLAGRRRMGLASPAPQPRVFGRVWRVERRRIKNGGPLPYGVAISLGWCLAVLPIRFG